MYGHLCRHVYIEMSLEVCIDMCMGMCLYVCADMCIQEDHVYRHGYRTVCADRFMATYMDMRFERPISMFR